MKKSLFYMLILLSIVFALTGCLPKTAGQEPPLPVVNIKAILPEDTPEDGTVYIVGNYSDWGFDNAATSDVKTDDEGKKYAEFELEISQFPLEYKYTIGRGWDYVEKGAEGEEIGNRVIESEPEDVIIDTVARWAAIPTPPGEEPTEPPTEGEITIDGDFSDWESYERAKTIVDDPDDDSEWGETNDVNWLGIAADEQYLYIGAQYKASENGFIVYISLDGDETGATDMNFEGWSRAIKFDKNVQYFVATWEYGDPQLWQVVDTQTKTEKSSLISDKYVEQNEGYEIKIPLSEFGLESGDIIYFVGCIVGGDGASSGDTAPDNDIPDSGSEYLTITNMAELIIQ